LTSRLSGMRSKLLSYKPPIGTFGAPKIFNIFVISTVDNEVDLTDYM